MSAFMHGVLLLLAVLLLPSLINKIPLASLAAILFIVAYRLAKPALFKKMYQEGLGQFVPFVVTILGIVFTDLLMGIGLGLVVAIFIILRNNFVSPFKVTKEKIEESHNIKITLSEEVNP